MHPVYAVWPSCRHQLAASLADASVLCVAKFQHSNTFLEGDLSVLSERFILDSIAAIRSPHTLSAYGPGPSAKYWKVPF